MTKNSVFENFESKSILTFPRLRYTHWAVSLYENNRQSVEKEGNYLLGPKALGSFEKRTPGAWPRLTFDSTRLWECKRFQV